MPYYRVKQLLPMLACVLVIAAVIGWASPYDPVVEPHPENIEEIWAIEDTRQESETPLITALENNGVALGYDANSNTFYCTLGMEHGDEWPDIQLTAPDAEDLKICFVDDYTYDWCSEAIREGYAYQIFAYNEEQFSYSQIVFTGLPIISMQAKGNEEIPAGADIAVEAALSYHENDGIKTYARSHKRGGGTLYYQKPKCGYKIEFTQNADGTDKTPVEIAHIGLTDEIILIPGVEDETLMREMLCWDLYGMIAEEDEPFGKREVYYTELFINHDYKGVFLVLRPFDYTDELMKNSSQAWELDSVYRTMQHIHPDGVQERPVKSFPNGSYELYYPAEEQEHPFEAIEAYARMFENAHGDSLQENRAFCHDAEALLDMDHLLEYMLFSQGCGMDDNVYNNLYIWAHREEEGYSYWFAPWDVDLSWDKGRENYEHIFWCASPILERVIELDCGNIARELALEIWQGLRETVLNMDTIEPLVQQYCDELVESGAFLRDAQRWDKEVSYPDGLRLCDVANLRFQVLDERIAEMASEKFSGRLIHIGPEETVDMGELSRAFVQ